MTTGYDPIDHAREGVLDPLLLKPGADMRLVVPGVLLGIDTAAARLRVSVNGSGSIRLPYTPGIYTIGRTVHVLRNPLEGGRSQRVLGPAYPAPSTTTGTITAVNAGANEATVTVGSTSYVLPYIPVTTYSIGNKVWVLRSPALAGAPELILGPCSVPPPVIDPDDEEEAPPVPADEPEFGTFTRTLQPTWTGTYDSYRSAWDRWNTSRYGGRSTLYQGDPSFSAQGPFKGLATYGNQVVNLGATAISKIEVRLRGAGLRLASYPSIQVQGSPHGSKPGGSPSSSGDTASGSPGKSGAVWVALPSSVRANFLDGDVKGLCLTGSGYNAVRGTSSGDGMALRVTFTRPI